MANTVLSVDDSATIRHMVARVVETLGMSFMEAADGREAMEIMEAHYEDIALVVLDVNMPEMDGFETLLALKKNQKFRSIPVMMVTTEAERSRILALIQAGAADYLVKPFAQEDLEVKIAGCFGNLF